MEQEFWGPCWGRKQTPDESPEDAVLQNLWASSWGQPGKELGGGGSVIGSQDSPKFCAFAVMGTLLCPQGRYGWENMNHMCVLDCRHMINIGDSQAITLSSERKSPEARAQKDDCHIGLSSSKMQVTHLRQLGAWRATSWHQWSALKTLWVRRAAFIQDQTSCPTQRRSWGGGEIRWTPPSGMRVEIQSFQTLPGTTPERRRQNQKRP